MDASVEVTAREGLEVTGLSNREVTAIEGPKLSHIEQVVWSLLRIDPKLTRRTDQARLRRLARLLDQSPEMFLIALERLRSLAHMERIEPSVFMQRYKMPPEPRRAALALAEVLALCGGGHLSGSSARERLTGLLDTIGHGCMVAEVHAAAVSLPSLPQMAPPVVPVEPWPDQAREMLGLSRCQLRLSGAKMRLLSLIHLDPRLTRQMHRDRLHLLVALFDPTMGEIAVVNKLDAWRLRQHEDPILKESFGHYPDNDPARADTERLVDRLGALCGWNTLSPVAIRIRRRRALMLFGHLD